MKGYRKLTPGEVIRAGDVYESWRDAETFVLPPTDYSVGRLTREDGARYYRKARTDGCPPGWRWADEDERACHELYEGGEIVSFRPIAGRTEDCGPLYTHTFNAIMPYPEDPRLIGGCPNCGAEPGCNIDCATCMVIHGGEGWHGRNP